MADSRLQLPLVLGLCTEFVAVVVAAAIIAIVVVDESDCMKILS